jgi:hypothetical protein
MVKQVLGFRQLSLRGLDAVGGEWKLVTMAYNLKRMHAMVVLEEALRLPFRPEPAKSTFM